MQMIDLGTLNAHYLDASAAAKLVVDEPGSNRIRPYFQAHSTFRMTDLCVSETFSVLKRKRYSEKKITRDQYFKAAFLFMSYFQARKIKVEDISLWGLFREATSLVNKFDLDFSDVLQVLSIKQGPFSAGAGESQSILITADEQLAEAARAEGLRVWNVLAHVTPP